MIATRSSLHAQSFCLAAAALAGCTSAVVVESEFPTPLVETTPISIGLFYDPELRDYIHAEALPRSSTWTIDLGDANLAMLEPLYATMFASTREVETAPPNALPGLDAVLSSSLDRFEFDVPRSTRDQFVEVWLQYRLQLAKPDGNVVIDWPVSGYGKAEIDGSAEDAVHRAAIVAMREAGATIATQFMQQPDVSYWLQERENARSGSNAEGIEPVDVGAESSARVDGRGRGGGL
jgi:hypothetical protein